MPSGAVVSADMGHSMRRLRAFFITLAVLAAGCAALASAAAAVDAAKTLRVLFSIAETSFDPQFASDAASDSVISNIYEQMLDYDYLARPVKLVPRTLEAMQTVPAAATTDTYHARTSNF